MQIKRQLAALGEYVFNRSRTVILSLLLLYNLFIGIAKVTSFPKLATGLLVICAYLALLWLPERMWGERTRIAFVVGTWMLTAMYWVIFDAENTAVVLILYLVGYIVLRMPTQSSVLLTGAIIAADALVFFLLREETEKLVVYSIVHAGTYVMFWGARLKREAAETSKLHYEQLREVHAELEKAHTKLQQTHQDLEEATVRLLWFAVLEERNRISCDLHDSIGHGLTSVIVQLQALPYILKKDAAEADISLKTTLEVARHCLQDVRTVVHQMAVDEAGLGLIALQSLVKQVREQGRLDIALTIDGSISSLNTEISESLYRILQEALTNVIRHAHASHVDVVVSESEGVLIMSVTDNGIWANNTTILSGLGLSSMKARSERAGGTLRIHTVNPHGLKLVVSIPLHEDG
ncbi:sensor histidine kinase [Bacillus cereus]|uniref:sensor histidine kinase n=1 Tax=Bacillus cereus TaxID=1396 RepID=UPI000BEBD126|nr:sensor histidine kinase [Bacillus cereus]PDZ06665.1 sensor histidine kinase [Bacillus cereus]PGU42755.1 sensor histidine kinase [Bacillus cereus]